MTRFPLASAFIKTVEDTAKHNGAKRISKIWLKSGKGALFNENTLIYLGYILKGTAARNAEIYIRYGNDAGKCRCCGLVFADEKNRICPQCGGASDTISLEKKFIIDMMEIER